MSASFISFVNIAKDYGAVRVVDNLELHIQKGEFVSLLGPSGSGKTTLLMMLAGFENATEGQILLDNKEINRVPSYKRNMGVVFQNYALFPHMTIAKNVAFALEMRGYSKAEITERVTQALDMVQLRHVMERHPGQLSGGQQQRVALARALVFAPPVILMDEPLGALDKQLREQMQLDIRELHHRLGLTIIFVTHDQAEALTMSDRIAVFNKGKIQQCSSPREVYDRPANKFVAEFVGETNLFEGTIKRINDSTVAFAFDGEGSVVSEADKGLKDGDKALMSLRPERITLRSGGDFAAGENRILGKVIDTVYQGNHLRVVLDTALGKVIASVGRKASEFTEGADVHLEFGSNDSWVIKQ